MLKPLSKLFKSNFGDLALAPADQAAFSALATNLTARSIRGLTVVVMNWCAGLVAHQPDCFCGAAKLDSGLEPMARRHAAVHGAYQHCSDFGAQQRPFALASDIGGHRAWSGALGLDYESIGLARRPLGAFRAYSAGQYRDVLAAALAALGRDALNVGVIGWRVLCHHAQSLAIGACFVFCLRAGLYSSRRLAVRPPNLFNFAT